MCVLLLPDHFALTATHSGGYSSPVLWIPGATFMQTEAFSHTALSEGLPWLCQALPRQVGKRMGEKAGLCIFWSVLSSGFKHNEYRSLTLVLVTSLLWPVEWGFYGQVSHRVIGDQGPTPSVARFVSDGGLWNDATLLTISLSLSLGSDSVCTSHPSPIVTSAPLFWSASWGLHPNPSLPSSPLRLPRVPDSIFGFVSVLPPSHCPCLSCMLTFRCSNEQGPQMCLHIEQKLFCEL